MSSTPGLGTTFFIYLPTAGAEQIQSAPESAPPARGAGEVICVVDDEQLVAQATRLTLDRFGYHTIVFNSSEECLRALRQEPDGCALLLSDQTMPGMTGMELSAKVRSFAPRMPILIMSGYFSKVSPGALEQIGHIALVAKPFTADEIARKVHQALHPQPAPPPERQPVGRRRPRPRRQSRFSTALGRCCPGRPGRASGSWPRKLIAELLAASAAVLSARVEELFCCAICASAAWSWAAAFWLRSRVSLPAVAGIGRQRADRRRSAFWLAERRLAGQSRSVVASVGWLEGIEVMRRWF